MRLEDMILISVDDHVVEPPDVFEGRLPAKYADRAPRVVLRATHEAALTYCTLGDLKRLAVDLA